MENNYSISGRTFDNWPKNWLVERGSGIVAVPRGTIGALGVKSKFGFVGFYPLPNASTKADPWEGWIRIAGLNSAGLSCDEQHLDETSYEASSGNASIDLSTQHVCEWAVMNFKSCKDVVEGLQTVKIVQGQTRDGPDSGHHYIFRDAEGTALVVEIVGQRKHLHIDLNDGGKTGFGVVTNSPPFPWHLTNTRMFLEKMQSDKSAVEIPGNWYSDDRFQRLWLSKSGMEIPESQQDAVAQALAVMNTVTVPMGVRIGTDSRPGEGSVATYWGAIYNHRDPTVYWRTAENPLLRRLRLKDLNLDESNDVLHLPLDEKKLKWFSDATSELEPRLEGINLQI